ncbi:RNA-binding S4 domain-containing protein [Photobacterium sp. TY1-4]|uniref:RNA-binding S4 domain-containing protein n=1 Tax=Photobacterium sp. TY1-4 TaxID=2899122 RepID=UPI0021C1C802|nr:RNA-binding S4 domain-containing protein [Photobacterium sp. TY1-4]UXI00252.1 RNA-binding S4 domain-containing protein [Photobacterium sp. TY1-4]
MSDHENEYEVEALGVEVSSQPIELYKVLKIANAVSGGGEAKFAIAEGYVAVNGELELRKRRKVYDGDVIEFNEEFYLVICDQPVAEAPLTPKVEKVTKSQQQPKPSKPSKPKSTSKSKPASKSAGRKQSSPKKSGPADQTTGRKPISF